VGERFAFKLKAPRNAIGGFGVLAEFCAPHWGGLGEALGIKNGVPPGGLRGRHSAISNW
jgi:hypothetical protein